MGGALPVAGNGPSAGRNAGGRFNCAGAAIGDAGGAGDSVGGVIGNVGAVARNAGALTGNAGGTVGNTGAVARNAGGASGNASPLVPPALRIVQRALHAAPPTQRHTQRALQDAPPAARAARNALRTRLWELRTARRITKVRGEALPPFPQDKKMADYYPARLSELVAWHANFAVEAAASGATLGLSAGNLTQIPIDSTNVALVVNYSQAVDDFRQEVTQFRDIVLRGDPLAAIPASPVAPATLAPGLGSLPGIEARTRDFATRIKASAGYTQAVGEAYGIVPPASGGPGTPTVSATAQTGSQVKLKIGKASYSVLAVDSRRGGGAWEQIGVSQTATFTDARAPLVAGQPEQREYRVQGMLNNARTGPTSDVAVVVTVP